jgi:hypothetical protein
MWMSVSPCLRRQLLRRGVAAAADVVPGAPLAAERRGGAPPQGVRVLAAGSMRASTKHSNRDWKCLHDLPGNRYFEDERGGGGGGGNSAWVERSFLNEREPPYLVRLVVVPGRQGLTLVHFSAQRKHILLDTLGA